VLAKVVVLVPVPVLAKFSILIHYRHWNWLERAPLWTTVISPCISQSWKVFLQNSFGCILFPGPSEYVFGTVTPYSRPIWNLENFCCPGVLLGFYSEPGNRAFFILDVTPFSNNLRH